MIYKSHPVTKAAQRRGRPVKISRRACVRLDPDVLALIKNSLRTVSWESARHALNAGLRHAFKKFAAPEQNITIELFDQIAFSAPLKRKRRHAKR